MHPVNTRNSAASRIHKATCLADALQSFVLYVLLIAVALSGTSTNSFALVRAGLEPPVPKRSLRMHRLSVAVRPQLPMQGDTIFLVVQPTGQQRARGRRV